jgi:hypothetical protein
MKRTLIWQFAKLGIKAMAGAPYKVYVVVDREFGEQLAQLEPHVPVWIVDTTTNKPVIERLWKEHADGDHLTGVTSFRDVDSSSPEDILLAELDSIDLHHGIYSADPPYTILEVLGTPLTARAKAELSAYGFNEFHSNSAGFTATRPQPLD